MKTRNNYNVKNKENKGISLIVLVITIIVTLLLIAAVMLAINSNNPSDSASEAVFRNDFVVLQNELTSSKLNAKINNFEASEDITISMYDPEINNWLPSLKGSPLEGNVEICNGEVVFIIQDETSEEYEWAKKMAGSEKVYINTCADIPKVFSPEIEANVKSGETATTSVVLKISGGVSDKSLSYYYEYSLDKGKTFNAVNDGMLNNTLTFDGLTVRQIVQVRTVATVDGEEVRGKVSEFDVRIDKTGTMAPIITATNGYISGTWTGDDVELTISSADPNADETLEYTLDGSKWIEYGSSTHIRFSEDGEYEVKARAITNNDIIGPESSAFKVAINKALPEAPTISRVDGISSGTWGNKTSVSIIISSNSLVSYYEYSTDEGATWIKWTSDSDPIVITAEGTTNVIARAYNYTGGLGATSNAFSVKVDTVRPALQTTLTSTTNSITATAKASDEGGSGIDTYIFYKDDEAVAAVKDNTYIFTNLKQATNYKIGCVVVDSAGNKSTIYEKSIYTEVVESPDIKINNENWTNSNVTATITKYSEQSTEIEYQIISKGGKLDANDWLPYNAPITISRNCEIYARAIDSTNQQSSQRLYSVLNIDKIKPDTKAPSATSTTNSITVTSKQEDASQTVEYAQSGINEDRIWYAIKQGDLWSEYQTNSTFSRLTHDTVYYVKTRVYDNAGNFSESEETEIKTKLLESPKVYFTYQNESGKEYTPGTLTNQNVFVRIDDADKEITTLRSKSGSAQYIASTSEGVLVTTNGITTIVVEKTDGVNIIAEEYRVEIDNVPPSVTDIEVISPESGKYKKDTTVTLKVKWSEDVTTTSAPLLMIAFGNSETREATYVSTSGNEMIYEYTIKQDDNGILQIVDYSGGEVLDSVKNIGTGEKKNLTGYEIIAANEFSITVAVTPTTGGTATGARSAYYLDDVTISATANTGYYFNKWTSSNSDLVFNNSSSPTTSFGMIAENVTVTANFEAIKYKVKYDANTGSGREFESDHVYDKARKLAKNTYEKPGYIFIGWNRDKNATEAEFTDEQEVINLSNTEGDVVTLYAIWQVGVSEYKVEHYLENVNSTAYVLTETENLTATTDTEVAAEVHEYLGFYFDEETSASSISGIVTGDGKLTLKLYYNRMSYTLSIDPNGGTFGGTSEISTITGKYESSVTLPDPKKLGYIFNGWVIEGPGNISSNRFTFDASDATIVAQWRPGTSYYKVEHYKENIDSTGYDLFETESLSGITESTVTAVIKDYTGFEENLSIDGTLTETELLPGNVTVLKVFYVRKTYNLTVDPNGGKYKDVENSVIIPGKYETVEKLDEPVPPGGYEVTYNGNGGTPEKDKDYTENLFASWTKTGKGELSSDNTEFKYLDGDGTLKANYTNNGLILTGASRQGYDFNGWYLSNTKVGTKDTRYVPNGPVTLTANWVPRSDTKYKVEHYRENVTKDGYELFETDNLEGITDTQATAINKTYEGFTYDSTVEGTVASGNINPDGSLVLKLYYTRNVHTLSFSIVPTNSGTVEKAEKYNYGQTVSIKATPNPGYLFSSWSVTTGNTSLKDATASETTFVMPDSDVSITANFVGITYTIKYDANKGNAGTMANSVFTYGKKGNLTKNTYTRPGYTFIGWSRDKDSKTAEFLDEAEIFNLTTTNGDTITLYAIWSAGTTGYQVLHYTENLDGTYSLYQTDKLTGTVDSTVYAEPLNITGFDYDSGNSNEITYGIAEYNKNLTLKLYYKRKSYTLTVDPNTGIFNSKTDISTITGKFEQTVTIQNPTKTGYTFTGWTTQGKGNISGTNYTFGASDETIKATYKANEYTVTYNYENATANNTAASKKVTFDSEYGELAAPSKQFEVSYNGNGGTVAASSENKDAIFSFVGWYLNRGYSVNDLITASSVVTISSDHSLYARWLGGSVVLPEATKTGYTLNGWYTSLNGTSKVGDAGESYVPSSNITLYARWKPNDNTVYKVQHYLENVNANGYDLKETDSLVGTTDAAVTASTKTYSGFTFDSSNANNVLEGNIAPDGSLILKVYYVRNTYKLSVDPNGGSFRGTGTVTDISKKYQQTETIENPTVPAALTVSYELNGGTVTLAENNTTSKYTFTGWTRSGVGTFNTTTKVYTYGLGNGTFKANYTNSTIILPEPTKVGYTFDAWYKESSFTNKIGDAGSEVSITASTTYYANWIPRTDTKYEVRHYLQDVSGNTYTLKDTDKLYGTTNTTATASTKTYSGFTYDEDSSTASGNIAPDGSLVLNLYYSRNLYSLTVNPNGGSWNNTTASTVINRRHGTVYDIADATPPANSNVSYEANGGSVTLSNENTVGVKTFASWKLTGAGSFNATTKKFTYGIGTSQLVANYNTASVTLPAATKVGYVFAGWFSDTTLKNYVGGASDSYTAQNDIKLYAKWDNALDTVYKVQHYQENADGTTYTLKETDSLNGETNSTVTADKKTYNGYTCDLTVSGTISSGTIAPDGSLILKLYYTRNKYNLTVNPNGGTWRNSTSNTIVSKKHGQTETIENPTPPTKYTVSYDLNSGSANLTTSNTDATKTFASWTKTGTGSFSGSVFTFGIGATSITANYSTNSVTLPTPTRLGYTFKGWYDSETSNNGSGNLIGAAGASYTPTSNVTLYAKWEANKVDYKVEHYVEEIEEGSYKLYTTDNLKGYTDSTATATEKTITGFTYDSSNTNNVKTGTVSPDSNNMLVLKLYYKRNSYSVTTSISPATAGSTIGSGTYKYEATVGISATVNNGYTFSSWQTTTSGLSIADSSSSNTSFKMPASDVNITANCSVNGYKITYVLNGGTEKVSNPTSYTVLTNTITLNSPVRDGYAFKGWTTPENLIPNKNVTIPKGSIGDKTFTANWQYATVDAVDRGSNSTTFDSTNGTFSSGGLEGSIVIYVYESDYLFNVETASNATLAISDSLNGTYSNVLTVSSSKSGTYKTTKACYVKISGTNFSGSVTLASGENGYIADKLPKYTRTAYMNDGTTSVFDIATYRKWDAKYYPTDKPTRNGYKFKGWSTDKNASAAGTYPESGTYGYMTGNDSIYAIWAKTTTYRVEYYRQNVAQNGYDSYESDVIEAIEGDSVTATEKDYSSAGFTLDKSISGTVTSGTVAADGSLTLKLYYTRNKYNLTVKPNGGSWNSKTTDSVINNTHGTLIDIPVPTRAGYEFSGWTKSGAGSITSTTPIKSTTQKFTYGVGVTTLTAKWTAITVAYKVEHYKQNTDYSFTLAETEDKSAVTGTTVTATSKTYTGFTYSSIYDGTVSSGTVKGDGSLVLKLYYTRNSGTLKIDPNGGTYESSSEVTTKTGLYETTYTVGNSSPPSGYTITYNGNGGTPSESSKTTTKSFSGYTKTGLGNYNSTTKVYTYGNGTGTLTANYSNVAITLPSATRTGYEFNGWYSDKDCKNSVGTSGGSYTATSNTTLYAGWTPAGGIQYKVQHYLENVDGTYPSTPSDTDTYKDGVTESTVNATAKTYTGYTYDSSVSGTVASGTVKADGSLVLKLYYPRTKYTLTLTASTGGSAKTSGSYKYGQTVTITATPSSGYSFNGWTTTTSGITIKDTSSTTTTFVMPASNVNITANFKANSYTLTVNPGSSTYTQNYNTTKSVSAPASSYKVSYDSNGGTSYSASTSTRGFSKWTLSGSGKISSDTANPTTFTYGAGDATLTASYNSTGNAITLPSPTKTGYTFEGWYDSETSNNGSGNLIGSAGASYSPTGNITLYAKWKINGYTLTVNPGAAMYTQNYATTKSVAAPESYYTITYDVNGGNSITASKSVREFSSWTLSGAGSISSTTANPTTFTYGAGASTLTASYNSSGNAITLPTARRVGYRFDGWYASETSNNGSGTLIGVGGAEYTPTENKTIYAKWTQLTYTLTVNPVGTKYTGTYNSTQNISLSPKYTIKFSTNGGSAVSNMSSDRTVTEWTLSGEGSLQSTTANPTVFTFGEGDATVTATYSTTGSAITLPSTSKTGYTFKGWYKDSTLTQSAGASGASFTPSGSSDTITLYAKWEINKYTVSTSSSPTAGGTTSGDGSYNYNSSVTVTATANAGYSFAGWYIGDTKKSSDASYTFTLGAANVSLVAKFTAGPADYTVNHYVMGTNGSYPTTATYTETKSGTTDSTVTLANIKKTGTGYSDANGIAYSYGQVGGTTVTTTTVLGDGSRVINLYYERFYGTLTTAKGNYVSDVTAKNAEKYYYGATVPTLTATLYKTAGYNFTFQKWVSNNTTYMADKTANPTGTFTWPAMPKGTAITLIANATRAAKSLTLTYNANGGSVTPASKSVTYGSTYGALANPTRTGYTFNGWSLVPPSDYEQLEYIVATGSQYIDTGYTATPKTGIEAVYQFTNTTVQQRIFGSETSSTNYMTYCYYINGSGKMAYGYKDGTGNWIATSMAVNTNKHTIRFNVEPYIYSIDSGTSSTITGGATKNTNGTLVALATRSNGSTISNYAKAYLYSFDIFEDGVLKKQLIPCRKKSTSEVGMYDIIGGTFYKSATATAFYAGPVKYTVSTDTVKIASNSTIYANWTANTVNYKVEHYVMGTNGSYPTTATATDTKTGLSDSTVTLTDLKKTGTGYSDTNGIAYDHGEVGGTTVTTTTVSPDGTRVIKLYYKRYYGYLTTAKGANVSAVTTQSKKKYYYGATVDTLTATLNTAASGYSINFSKWTTSNGTYLKEQTSNPLSFTWPAMPEGTEITLTAVATNTPKTDIKYTVEHYVMDTSGTYSSSTPKMTYVYEGGTTGASITLTDYIENANITVENGIVYDYGQVDGKTVTTTTIKGDGSLVIKQYYKRTYGTLTTAKGNYVSSVTAQNKVKYYYGATVPTLTATLNTTAGYNFTFQSWATSNATYLAAIKTNPTGTFTWPAMPEGTAITLTANASRSPKVLTITLDNTNATTKGATAVYEKYATGVYKESGCTNQMTTTTNPVSVPSRTGYTFGGWYTGSGGTGTQMIASDGYLTPSSGTEGYSTPNFTSTYYTADATLYPKWDINTSTLTINPNSGSVSVTSPTGGTAETITSSKSYTQNYNTKLSYGKPTRANSVTTNATYTVNYDYNGSGQAAGSATAKKTTTTSYTFKEWTKSTTFYGTLSSTTAAGTYTYPANNNVTSTITASWNSTTADPVTASVTLPTPTAWTGHTFNGWYTASSGGTKVGGAGDSYTPTATTTLYAQWTTHSSTLTINPNGGSVSVTSPTGGTATTITSSTNYKQNYNTTLTYGKPTKANTTETNATYTVNYNYNGSGQTAGSATAKKTTTTSYTFKAWEKSTTFYGTLSSTTAAGTYTYPANNSVTSTITASWNSTTADPVTASVTLPTPTAWTGHTFNGWYTASSGGTKVGGAGDSYTPTATTTLYAQWTTHTSTLTINPNGGSVSVTPNGSTARTISTSTSYTQNYSTTLAYGKPTRANSVTTDATYTVSYDYNGSGQTNGSATSYKKTTTTYTFSSWSKSTTFYGTLSSTTGAGTYTYPTNNSVTSTITASWSSSSSTATDQLTLPTPNTRTGYTFNGWYTASSGGTKVGGAGDKYTPTASTTLYAQWSINSYTFSRSASGSGTVTGTANGTLNYGTSISVTATANSGYTFIGWYTAASGGTKVSSSATYTTTMPASNLTLVARFQCNTCNLVKLTGSNTSSQYTVSSNAFNSSSSAGVEGVIYVPANGVGLVFKISSSSQRATLSYSSTLNGTYTELVSLGGSSSSATYTSTYTTGYFKVNITSSGGASVYMADGTTACKINDNVTGYIKQQTTPGFSTSFSSEYTASNIATVNYAASPTFKVTGGCYTTIYLPVSGYKIAGTSSVSATVRYYSGMPNLYSASSYSQVATVSSSSTYTTTTGGYFIFYGSASTVQITPPNGGYMKLQLDLPTIDATNTTNTTFSNNHIKISGIGAFYFKPITRRVYIKAYKQNTGSATIKSSTTTTFSGTGTKLQSTSWAAYSTALTTSYYYQISGYGEYYFYDEYGSACRVY